MPPLYVVQQQAKLRVSNRRLIVTIEDGAEQVSLTSIPVAQVSQVVLYLLFSGSRGKVQQHIFAGIAAYFRQDGGSSIVTADRRAIQ